MKIKFKTDEWDSEKKCSYMEEHIVPVEEIASIYTVQDTMYIDLKNGEELSADSPIYFTD